MFTHFWLLYVAQAQDVVVSMLAYCAGVPLISYILGSDRDIGKGRFLFSSYYDVCVHICTERDILGYFYGRSALVGCFSTTSLCAKQL